MQTSNPKRPRGRPRKAETRTISVRAPVGQNNNIESMIATAKLRNPDMMKLSAADIIEQALSEYLAARSETRNQKPKAMVEISRSPTGKRRLVPLYNPWKGDQS